MECEYEYKLSLILERSLSDVKFRRGVIQLLYYK